MAKVATTGSDDERSFHAMIAEDESYNAIERCLHVVAVPRLAKLRIASTSKMQLMLPYETIPT